MACSRVHLSNHFRLIIVCCNRFPFLCPGHARNSSEAELLNFCGCCHNRVKDSMQQLEMAVKMSFCHGYIWFQHRSIVLRDFRYSNAPAASKFEARNVQHKCCSVAFQKHNLFLLPAKVVRILMW